MRILKIATYTSLIGITAVLLFSYVYFMGGTIFGIAILTPPFVGLYFFVTGIFESIQTKSFKMKILLGIGICVVWFCAYILIALSTVKG